MVNHRTIAVVTGTRAEFGLLEPVMRAIDLADDLRLVTVVAGLHLITSTKRDITDAGFAIDHEVAMQMGGTAGRLADAEAVGRGVLHMAEVWGEVNPTFAVVLGDRVEAFAAAAAASVGGIRVAHLHGGDRAEGVADDAMRHAITKLAHLHLPATEQSARRIVQMGEEPARVHIVGSPAIDALADVLAAEAGPDVIVLQHPVGDDDGTERRRMISILQATDPETTGMTRLVLAPNHDPGRDGIVQAIDRAGVDAITHMPRMDFLAILKAARVIVGNSSAGLIEAAALHTACVDLGRRQAGRERPGHVVPCESDDDPQALRTAIETAIDLKVIDLPHPYGDGRTGPRVAELLAHIDLDTVALRKRNAY